MDPHLEPVPDSSTAQQRGLDDTVRDLAPRLLRFALGRCGNRALAEETSQDALLALVSRWRRLGPPERPRAFVFTILRRRLARRQLGRRLVNVPMEALREAFGFEPAADDDPVHRAEVRQELRDTLEDLDELSPKIRDALLLVAGAGLDTQTAANVLGISPSALKMRVSRGREELRRRSSEGPDAAPSTDRPREEPLHG